MIERDPEYRGTSDDAKAKEFGLPGNDLEDVWDTFGGMNPADLIALQSYMIEKHEQMRPLVYDDDEETAVQARIFGEWHWARATVLEVMISHLVIHGPGASRWGDMSEEQQQRALINLSAFSKNTRDKIRKAVDLEERDRRMVDRFHALREDGRKYEEALADVAEEFNFSSKTVEAALRKYPKNK